MRSAARRLLRTFASRTATACLAVGIMAGSVFGQQGRDALEEARRLRDAGELDLAVTVLRQRLERDPGDVDARWLLAQTLYWTGDVEMARAEYARGLADRPDRPGLRLEYARFLLDTGRASQAGHVLAPLAERAPPGWGPEIERLERAILAVTAPWARVTPDVRDDSQPLTRQSIAAEVGFWPIDGLSLAVRAVPQRFEGEFEIFGEERDLAAVEAVAEVAFRRADVPVSVEAVGGVFSRDSPETTDAIGGADVTVRLPRAVTLRGGASRGPYLWTVASLDRGVLVDALEVALDRANAPGWAFQAGVRRETFVLDETSGRDDNAVTSAWAWALAPLWVRERGSFRAGYAFQWQDSEETRFTDEGIYDPYYTPEEVLVHNVIAAIALRPSPVVTLHADGAVGAFAEERAPVVVGASQPGTGVTFIDRDFTPWRARASVTAGLGAAGELRAEIERNEDAFFESTRGEVSITWWLAR